MQIKTTMKYQSEWLSLIRMKIANAGEGVEKRKSFALLVGMYIGTYTMENNTEFP